VAKILVADDNSNVQKTVTLALVELGVEVVAVNNGDAAVRKLADISPDLVLADIFMPVRNGYEVCEYVKKDSRFAHVPVVLLVGAFDPLDEREAQRVGADGILKKPFVPPDPLITMVKTLLERSLGDRLVAVATSKPAVVAESKGGGIATAEQRPAVPEISEEPSEEEFQTPVDRVSFGDGERPIAFGQLLESPAMESAGIGSGVVEPVDDEQILTSSRDASLGDPIFWKTEEPTAETEEEQPEAEADVSSGLPSRPWKLSDEKVPASPPEADPIQPIEPFELVRDQDEESSQTSTNVESSATILQDAASQASLTVEPGKPEDLAANPIEWMATAPPLPAEESQEQTPELSVEATHAADEHTTDEMEAIEPADLTFAAAPVVPQVSTPFTPPVSETISAPTISAQAPQPAQPQAKLPDEIPETLKTHPSLSPLAQSAEDTARSIPRQEWADLAASLETKPIEPDAEKSKTTYPRAAVSPAVTAASTMPAAPPVAEVPPANTVNAQSAPTNSAPTISVPAMSAPAISAPAISLASNSVAVNSASPAAPDPALVEAVVQRILEKMRPQVVDIITKEFLRPIVQALVHREIEKR
jgi:CheY-like chemotaxis protein